MTTTLIVAILASSAQAYADPLKNASRQRIGNYDVEMTTEPKNPVIDTPAKVMIRIAGVNGDDLVDVPITTRMTKDGIELNHGNPVIVPYGHYTFEYTFTKTGRYVLYIDLSDYAYSGQLLTFTFFVNVSGAFDYLYIAAPSAAAITVGVAAALIFMKRKRNQIIK